MAQSIPATDPRFTWSGAISTEVSNGSVTPWRIPHTEKALFDVELAIRAAMPAGVRLSFRSNTTAIIGQCNSIDERSGIDLVVNGKLIATADTANQTSFQFGNLGTDMKDIELWMPQFGSIRVDSLMLDDNAETTPPAKSSAPKWITYGSSITHCRTADSPTRTWPAIVAHTRGYDLTCLGFGGQCHLDPMIARVIRDREADLISLCVGINIHSGSLNQRTFGPGIIGFVQIIREKHPTTPIALISPIFSPDREDTPNVVGFTLKQMRSEVAGAAEILTKQGDQNIHYINGLDVFGSDYAHLLPDNLHPNNEGYGIMAENLLRLFPNVK
jgi:lysophospholipase L1-like esterase